MSDAGQRPAGYAGSAIKGSAWTALQTLANKVAAATATIVLGYLLQPTDFGAAWFAVSSALLVSVFHVIALGDVLLAYPRQFDRLSAPCQRLALFIGAGQAMLIGVSGWALASLYPDRPWMAGLMMVAACRPLCDALAVVPLARLRRDLQFRRIALIDGATALVASALSVLMAAASAGPLSIVLPPIALIAARGLLYRRISATKVDVRPLRGTAQLLRRAVLSAVGSYVAGVLFLLETMVLGFTVTDRSLGLFAFAFGLASQVNSVVSFQIAGALQPIFGHLDDDPRRQVAGMVRSCRLISAVLVPALLVQAAVGNWFIEIAWGGKWDDAALIFRVLSVGQALYICQWPAAFVLKSQGRFRTYLLLQLANIMLAAAVFWIAALRGGPILLETLPSLGLSVHEDALAPLAVAAAGVGLLALFGPIALWAAGSRASLPIAVPLDILWRPWLTGVPVAFGASAAAAAVAQRLQGSLVAQVALLVAIGAVAAVVGITGSLALSATTRSDGLAILRVVRARLARGTQGP